VHTEHSKGLCQNHTTGNYLMGENRNGNAVKRAYKHNTREQFLFRKCLPFLYSIIRWGIIIMWWFRLFYLLYSATKAQQPPKLNLTLQSTCQSLMLFFFPVPQWWHEPFAQKRWHWVWIAQARLTEVMTMDSTHLT